MAKQKAAGNWRIPPPIFHAFLSELAQPVSWAVDFLGMPEAWKESQGEGITVGIIDTGCDVNHPDLAGAIEDAKDFTGSRFGYQDRHGHGTHVAGTVGGRNQKGVTGMAPKCRLKIAKGLGDNGSGSGQGIQAALHWLTDGGCDVISMSLGSPFPDDLIFEGIQYAKSRGVTVICAAGNSGPKPNTTEYPGKWKLVVCVGAVGEDRKPAQFSSRGPELDVMAPGVEIVSCWPGGGYASLSGTSMATPCVSGVTGLYFSHEKRSGRPRPNPDQALAELTKTAVDVGKPGFDPDTGYGLVSPKSLVDDDGPPPGTTPRPPDDNLLIVPAAALKGKTGVFINLVG